LVARQDAVGDRHRAGVVDGSAIARILSKKRGGGEPAVLLDRVLLLTVSVPAL
jgi:hypothetical protein